jgi:hypothetical protein
VIIEVVVPVCFTLCIADRGPTYGARNPFILRGARRGLAGNSRLGAVRLRAILDGFMFIDFGFVIVCNAHTRQLDVGGLILSP